jgi:hypothetical protein
VVPTANELDTLLCSGLVVEEHFEGAFLEEIDEGGEVEILGTGDEKVSQLDADFESCVLPDFLTELSRLGRRSSEQGDVRALLDLLSESTSVPVSPACVTPPDGEVGPIREILPSSLRRCDPQAPGQGNLTQRFPRWGT